ncbi:MAG TPA: hypothetical protein VE338_06890 [Ktedonobacterales bacterium]|jgi:hypothetical protein|nr:hypothetical protein [Ktedonobacterales bacterium]
MGSSNSNPHAGDTRPFALGITTHTRDGAAVVEIRDPDGGLLGSMWGVPGGFRIQGSGFSLTITSPEGNDAATIAFYDLGG